MLEAFRHITQYRVPFGDVDMMRHVNHCSFVRWAETARSEYFVDVLGESVHGERGLILARIDFAYERQLSYRDYVAIGARISRIGTRSFDFVYEIFDEESKERAAHGTTTMVAYDYVARSSIVVPRDWHEKIAAYEIKLPDGLVPPT